MSLLDKEEAVEQIALRVGPLSAGFVSLNIHRHLPFGLQNLNPYPRMANAIEHESSYSDTVAQNGHCSTL